MPQRGWQEVEGGDLELLEAAISLKDSVASGEAGLWRERKSVHGKQV